MNYPYIPKGKDIKYVPANDRFMVEAKKLRDNYSTDFNHKTGAIVVRDGVIIGSAANRSKISNQFLINLHKKGLCFRKLFRVKTGQKYWLCPGCASSKYHAEHSAVVDALSNGNKTAGADVYLYGHWWCCKQCWDKMIEAEIRNVYLVDNATELFKK
jgi:deoxycytidylate deaminase